MKELNSLLQDLRNPAESVSRKAELEIREFFLKLISERDEALLFARTLEARVEVRTQALKEAEAELRRLKGAAGG